MPKSEEWLTFGRELAAARKTKRYSQTSLGVAVGVVQPLISAWESQADREERTPNRTRLAELIDLLDRPDWSALMGEDPERWAARAASARGAGGDVLQSFLSSGMCNRIDEDEEEFLQRLALPVGAVPNMQTYYHALLMYRSLKD